MPPKTKKYKKVVIKEPIVIQGFNIESGNNNILKGAYVMNNVVEKSFPEEKIIQGFNLVEKAGYNDLEGTFAKDNKVMAVNYESESTSNRIDELKGQIISEEELEKSFEKQRLGLKSIEKMVKEEKRQRDNNKGLQKTQILGVESRKLQIDKSKPTLEYSIGRGGYGEVYRGKWKTQDVAVKKLYLSFHNISKSDIKDIQKEVEILERLKSKYIIQYYGAYSDKKELLIIMDYAENGTLTNFINERRKKEHDWTFNTNLIKQMTQGLTYIHHENIIHRDLKSMNILLAHGYQVKISDFGLSKTKNISSSQSKSEVAGTLRWMAPELLRGEKYSEQSDIYALGMIIWEIAAKCTTPFKDINDILLASHVARNEKETIPSDVPENVCCIIEGCWKSNPNERENLANIFEMIKGSEPSLKNIEFSEARLQSSQEIEKIFRKNFDDFENLRISDTVKSSEELEKGFNSLEIGSDSKKMLTAESEEIAPIKTLEQPVISTEWTSLKSNFTPELKQNWQILNFTYQQTQDWINVGLQPADYNFCAWLRDTKNLTPEQVLNHHNLEQLNQEFFIWWQQNQFQFHQEILPKNNN